MSVPYLPPLCLCWQAVYPSMGVIITILCIHLSFFILFVRFDIPPCYNGLPAFSIGNGTPEDKFCRRASSHSAQSRFVFVLGMLQIWSHLGSWVLFCFVYGLSTVLSPRLFLFVFVFVFVVLFFPPSPVFFFPPTTSLLSSALRKHNGFRPPSLDFPYD